MSDTAPQFGVRPSQPYRDRPGAYVVVFDEENKLLVMEVNGVYHLPGGGIAEGETAEEAVGREVYEEAGCTLGRLVLIGKANQFIAETTIGLLNKLGTFFRSTVVHIEPHQAGEPDHQPRWIDAETYLHSAAPDFQKWAVRKALD